MVTLLPPLVGLALWAGVLGLAWTAYLRHRRLSRASLVSGWLGVFALAFLARGLFGEASTALVALTAVTAGWLPLDRRARFLLAPLLLGALLFYASALGFVATDLYATGYHPRGSLGVVALATLGAYFCLPVLAWAWLAGLVLHVAGVHPSPNLWDVLIDVPAMLLATRLFFRASAAGNTPR